PTFWLAFCSHLLVTLSSVSDPVSSPGHGTAAAPRAPIARARIEMATPRVCMKGPPCPSDADAVRQVKRSGPGRSSRPARSAGAEEPAKQGEARCVSRRGEPVGMARIGPGHDDPPRTVGLRSQLAAVDAHALIAVVEGLQEGVPEAEVPERAGR